MTCHTGGHQRGGLAHPEKAPRVRSSGIAEVLTQESAARAIYITLSHPDRARPALCRREPHPIDVPIEGDPRHFGHRTDRPPRICRAARYASWTGPVAVNRLVDLGPTGTTRAPTNPPGQLPESLHGPTFGSAPQSGHYSDRPEQVASTPPPSRLKRVSMVLEHRCAPDMDTVALDTASFRGSVRRLGTLSRERLGPRDPTFLPVDERVGIAASHGLRPIGPRWAVGLRPTPPSGIAPQHQLRRTPSELRSDRLP
jgi:hypothetical protein